MDLGDSGVSPPTPVVDEPEQKLRDFEISQPQHCKAVQAPLETLVAGASQDLLQPVHERAGAHGTLSVAHC